jgi:hypothetical protein
LLVPLAARGEADGPQRPVRLAVLVIFDQFRGDYLQRWDTLFGDDGFRRLEREGVWFENCHYPYALTLTGPGHASLATGASPSKHGIIANEWYEQASGEVYCTGHFRFERVPPLPRKKPAETDPKEARADTPRGQGTPERLLLPTLADALKDATVGQAKVVSLSMKDRSAILPGGRHPDACYWFDTTDGRFVTSTYYRDAVHPWVADYNASRPADVWFGKKWTRLRADLDYEKYSGPDEVLGEDSGFLQGRVFPHPFGAALLKPGKMYYDAVNTSPFGNEILLGLVKRAIDAEKLGTRDVPDLLCIGFSSNDPVGHVWGPDSQEVLDATLRSDLIVKDLLEYLDAKVGKGSYVLALSSDHGVCPLPEVAAKQGKDAKRVIAADEGRDINEFLETTFPKKAGGKPVKKLLNESVYLNREWLKAQDADQARIEEALAGWLGKRPVYQAAYTRSQLLRGVADDDQIGQMVRRSFHADRSADVMMVLKPYHIVWARLKGTSHGTPYDYDTHVPLLLYGPGLAAGSRKDPVTPQAAVPVLARALGIKPPPPAEAPVPEKLFAAP